MAVLPIDLQALYAQSIAVGREQAVVRDGPAAAQAAQGSEMVRRTEQEDSAVNDAPEVGDGPDGPDPDGGDESSARRRDKQRRASAEQEPPRGVVRDPQLGQHIDVVG